jgi:hypothetical protein
MRTLQYFPRLAMKFSSEVGTGSLKEKTHHNKWI